MIQLPIVAIPNQSFTAVLENESYDITLTACNGAMCCSVARNNVPVISNVRILPFQPIIPYQYLENGNLFITTLNDDVVDFTAFGVTQNLFYASVAEMEALRATAGV